MYLVLAKSSATTPKSPMQRNRTTTAARAKPAAGRESDIDEIVRAIRVLSRGVNSSSRGAEQRWRVSSAQLLVLRILAESPSASVNDLAAQTDTHQSTVSVVVGRLVRRGLVRRRRAADDARRTELALTPAGWSLHRDATAAELRHVGSALSAIPRTRLRGMATSLAELGDAMSHNGNGNGRANGDENGRARPAARTGSGRPRSSSRNGKGGSRP